MIAARTLWINLISPNTRYRVGGGGALANYFTAAIKINKHKLLSGTRAITHGRRVAKL